MEGEIPISLKAKVLGAALLVSAALCANAVLQASATTGGHFTSEVGHALIETTTSPEPSHNAKFQLSVFTIVCTKAEYFATTPASTVTEVAVSPVYEGCATPDQAFKLTVNLNGCNFLVKIGKHASEENTVQVNCPTGQKIELTFISCQLTIAPQAVNGGLKYTTVVSNEKHALTVDINTEVTFHNENACALFPTKGAVGLAGAMTVKGLNTEGAPVGITATGSEV